MLKHSSSATYFSLPSQQASPDALNLACLLQCPHAGCDGVVAEHEIVGMLIASREQIRSPRIGIPAASFDSSNTTRLRAAIGSGPSMSPS